MFAVLFRLFANPSQPVPKAATVCASLRTTFAEIEAVTAYACSNESPRPRGFAGRSLLVFDRFLFAPFETKLQINGSLNAVIAGRIRAPGQVTHQRRYDMSEVVRFS